jgi:hypothetical protein
MKKLLIITCVTSIIVACQSSEKPPISKSLIEQYNDQIKEGYDHQKEWATSPLAIAIELTQAGKVSKETSINMKVLNTGEVATKVKITVAETGVLDDANSNSNAVFYMEKKDEQWIVVETP